MTPLAGTPKERLARGMTALSENTYLSSIRAGLVAVVPLTIVGGLFLIVAYLPVNGWAGRVAPYLMDLREFDQVILSGRIPILNEFLDGLEPEFRPGERDASCLAEVVK